VWNLLPFVGFLEAIGAPVERWLEASKIPVELVQNPSRAIPFKLALGFAERAARAEGAETLGIDVGRRVAGESLGSWGQQLAACPTLYDRIATTCRMLPLLNTGAKMWLEIDGQHACLGETFVDGLGPGIRHGEDFALMLALEGIGRTAGPGWRPVAIHVPGRRSERFSRDELFRDVRLVFGAPHLKVVFHQELLSRPLDELPTSVVSNRESKEGSPGHDPARDFVGSLEDTIASLLPRGCPSIHEIAGIANTSVRSLQRRLGESGLSLTKLVDRARFRLADEYLRDPTATVTEVAFQLGYSNPPAFTRAFRRLTGESPTTYKERVLEA
jgi:AraC-like DNA-binding protein